MGREIRRVPPDWQHPTIGDLYEPGYEPRGYEDRSRLHPQYDKNYDDAAKEWLAEAILWSEGKHPGQAKGYGRTSVYYWEYAGGPPDEYYYRAGAWAFTPEQATHYQMYEDTTEGTPISPVFATPEEVARYCADHNVSAFAGQTASYESWLRIARGGYAPSAVMLGDGRIVSGVEGIVATG